MKKEKITICGSMGFIDKIIEIKNSLEKKGYEVFYPEIKESVFDYEKLTISAQVDKKQEFINRHIKKIKNSDSILVVNEDKKGIKNYIGANTFLEIGFAYISNKKIFLLNDFPKQDNILEIMGMRPIVINGDLEKINI